MKAQTTFEEHLRKSNLSENTITSYLWTVEYFHTHYDSITKENLLAYKGYLMEFFKPKTVNLRIQGINKYLMLIESDKRGVELQLLYADEQFSIPSNIHIIGMMNTADRSLAMLDYALRRRFAFFEICPAFSSSGFRAYRMKINNQKFDRLIATVERLNDVIASDDSLGDGFCIGHSYFCTKATINDEWMKSVVEYELIPLLKEYWFDEAAKVKDWSRTLREVVK